MRPWSAIYHARRERPAVGRLVSGCITRRTVEHRLERGPAARGSHDLAGAGGRGRDLLFLAVLGRLDDATLPLDRCKRAAVQIVDVSARLQLAGAVDEGRLIREVDPDLRLLELNVLLVAAEHALDPLRRPVLAGTRDLEKDLRIFGRVLHAHAAVTVRAHLVRKHVFVRGVVLIDQEPVRETEPDAPERVAVARRLGDLDVAAVIAHAQAHAGEHGG